MRFPNVKQHHAPEEVSKIDTRMHVLLFIIGLSSAASFKAVGQVFASDILFTLLFPFSVFYRTRSTPWRYAAPIVALAGLWLLSAMLTDVIRQSPFENYARGWAKIIFFMVSFLSLLGLSKARVGRLMSYFGGLAVAALLSATFWPDEFQRGEPWKFGYSPPLAMLAVIAASLPLARHRLGLLRSAGPPGVMAVLNLMFNFRSHYAILVATAGLTAVTSFAQRIAPKRKLVSPVLVLGLILAAGAVGWGSTAIYSNLAATGALGERAKHKYEMQNSGDAGILLSGRSESLFSVKAIEESPIIGHGSWAEDRYYVALRILMLRERGILTNPGNNILIPTHSYFFGAWVEAGFLGAAFWLFIFIYAARATVYTIDIRSNATPFVAYLLFQLLWSIPFSPFGAAVRFVAAGQLCLIIWAIRAYRGSPQKTKSGRTNENSVFTEKQDHI